MDDKLPSDGIRSAPSVDRAHRMFNRVLVSWAGDVLELRRRNLLNPVWSQADPAHPATSPSPCQDADTFLPMKDAA